MSKFLTWPSLAFFTCLMTSIATPSIGYASTLSVVLNKVNNQDNGSFILGGVVPTLTFHVTGATPNTPTHINYTVSDENSKALAGPIQIAITPDGSGNANPPAVNAPASKLGYYRVDANLDNGTVLYPVGKEVGTRPPGFITYAVMNNPDTRFAYSSSLTRFGLEDLLSGGSSTSTVPSSTLAYLGVKWVGSIEQQWVQLEKNGPNTFSGTLPISYWNTTAATTPTGAQWPTFTLLYFTATHTPGWAKGSPCGSGNTSDFCALNGTGASELPNFARRYAAAAKAQYPNQDRYYQITWESKDIGGSYSKLLQYYQLVYSSIHSADPQAIVVGPTMFIVSENILIDLNNAGNPPYSAVVDGSSMHNYANYPPESGVGYWDHTYPSTPNNIPSGLTLIRGIHDYQSIMKGFKGVDVPLIGTESGYKSEKMFSPYDRTKRADVDKGLLQHALGNVRQTLIWLGEGAKFDTLFRVMDFWFTTPTTDPGSTWGVYFNLDSASPGHGNYGSRSLGPKPSAPAYSAMSFLLDGFDKSNGAVPGLTGTQMGYSFARTVHDPRTIYALWDWGTAGSVANVPVPSGSYQQCDWMGNCTPQTSNGTVSVALNGSPIYLLTGGSGGITQPPANTSIPTISGSAQVGSTLTAGTGTWTNSPTSFTYQWNSAGNPVTGATAVTYVPTSSDVGNTITVSVVATNSIGSSSPSTSAPTSAVTNPAPGVPVNTSIPTISGSPTVGSTLTADPGTWTNSPTSYAYTWSWEDFGTSPFHGTTFVVRSADVGHKLGVTVIATDSAGNSTPVRSALTATVH